LRVLGGGTSRLLGAGVLVLAGLLGVVLGVGGYTFVYARGSSYLTDDPAACANCHVMQEQYAGWRKGSHHAVAGCNDCHTPAGFIAKYLTKAKNGYHHSAAFTRGGFHEPIRITETNRAITEGACRNCHGDVTAAMDGPVGHGGGPRGQERQERSCIRCHVSVGHL
jgi:cytochrome c nitrite reductase small subunit